MFRFQIIASVVALVLCLAFISIVSAAPARAHDPLPDARILSAAPFDFRADQKIFSRMNAAPTDSRIFSPRESQRPADESKISQTGFENARVV